MTIKDFKPGQTAYGVSIRRIYYQNRDKLEVTENIDEYTVQKAGKKYVYASRNPGSFAERFEMAQSYAIKGSGYNNDDVRLFPSRQAIDDWKERIELQNQIRSAADCLTCYSLDQLRRVWEILKK